MKIDASVRRATLIVAAGVMICSAVMQLVYLIIVMSVPSLSWHYSFVLGNLLMGSVMVLNFFLMSVGIQRTVESGDVEHVKLKIRFSYVLRSLLVLAALIISFVFGNQFHIVATIITVSFPQITILLSRLFIRNQSPTPLPVSAEEGETPPAEQADATGGEEDNGQV